MKALLLPGQGGNPHEIISNLNFYTDKWFSRAAEIINQTINQENIHHHAIHSVTIVAKAFADEEKLIELGHRYEIVAGYSVAQFAALALSGVISKTDALELVWKRSILMEKYKLNNTGMVSILGLSLEKLENLIHEILKDTDADKFLEITNYNSIENYTISGSKYLLERLERSANELLCKKIVPLPVGGAWHSSMFLPAKDEFKKLLDGYEFKNPSIKLIENVEASSDHTIDKLRDLVLSHLYKPVQWEKTMDNLINQKVETCFFGGPGKQLMTMFMFKTRKVKFFSIEEL